jgi:hypothetical protein
LHQHRRLFTQHYSSWDILYQLVRVFTPPASYLRFNHFIRSVPNLILAFIPAEINGNTLNTMTAFATGGLLSDVFLHLVPHSFMGEHQHPGVHFVMVEEKRNILIGCVMGGILFYTDADFLPGYIVLAFS